MFGRYMLNDKNIIKASPLYADLPDTLDDPSRRKLGRGMHKTRGRRPPAAAEYSTTDSPVSKRMKISLDFTTSEDEEVQSGDDS